MATKKGRRKRSSGKKSDARIRAGHGGSIQHKAVESGFAAPGNPPIILGGGGSIVIYSDQPLETPNDVPPLAGYPYVYVHPDRTLTPKHFRSKKRAPGGGQVWRKTFNPKDDLLEVETT